MNFMQLFSFLHPEKTDFFQKNRKNRQKPIIFRKKE